MHKGFRECLIFIFCIILLPAFAAEEGLFQKAKTLRTLEQYDEAISLYKNRLKNGGDRDELWLAKYMLGECFEEMGDWDRALYWYIEAHQENPSYVIALKKLATHYRLAGKNEVAYLFAQHGARIPFPDGQSVLGSPAVYGYQFDEEISISAFYTRFRADGAKAADHLILSKHVPWHIRNQTYVNLQYYVQNLKNARFMPIMLDLPLIHPGSAERYHPMNPSIRKIASGYEVICRSVNYTQTGAKIFQTNDTTGVFRTRNFLAHYDRDFNLISQREIIERLPRERVRSFNIEGLDDCRVFEMQNCSWFTCTTSDTNPTGNFQISLCKLAEDRAEKNALVEKLIPLKGPDPYRCEKNWLPFIRDGDLYLVYSIGPLVIYKPDLHTGDCETIVRHDSTSYDFSHLRGSAAPIEFDEGYLMLAHEVVYLPDYERRYLHRFVYCDKDYKVTKLSAPFTFRHIGIEFCCGMVTDHTEKNLILTIGIEDREAYLCFVGLNDVRDLLYTLD